MESVIGNIFVGYACLLLIAVVVIVLRGLVDAFGEWVFLVFPLTGLAWMIGYVITNVRN